MGRTDCVEVPGAQLRFIREGHGIPCLVAGSPTYYRRALPQALRDHFELIFCDLRHWVPTSAGFDPATITIDTYSDDIEALRHAAGVQRPIVLGHSIHGSIALEYARRYPDARGVVDIAAPPVGTAEMMKASDDLWAADASPERKAAHERNIASRRVPAGLETAQDIVDYYVANGAKYWFDPEFDASDLWAGVEANIAVFNQLMGPLYGAYELAPLDVPVFLALGRYDYVVPYTLWEGERAKLSRCHYRLFERSGHTPPHEQREDFVADLVAWAETLT